MAAAGIDPPLGLQLSKSPNESFLAVFDRLLGVSDTVFVDASHRKVFRWCDAIIKIGRNVRTYEADVLRFLREQTTVPVPKVYGDFTFHGTHVVIFEYVEGMPLSEVWPTTSHDDKLEISRQLRQILQTLRENRQNYIGGIGNTVAVDSRKFMFTGGPFATERQFNTFLRSDLISPARGRFLSMFQKIMNTNHDIVLTHGDLNLRNIIVHGRQIKALIDWENAGWYPEYWEYVKFFGALDDPGLDDYIDEIFLQTYPQELANDLLLGQLLRH